MVTRQQLYRCARASLRMYIYAIKRSMPPGEESMRLVGTNLLNWYLNEVAGLSPGPRRRGGAVVVLHRRGRERSGLQGDSQQLRWCSCYCHLCLYNTKRLTIIANKWILTTQSLTNRKLTTLIETLTDQFWWTAYPCASVAVLASVVPLFCFFLRL
jgi:hypothetical protein